MLSKRRTGSIIFTATTSLLVCSAFLFSRNDLLKAKANTPFTCAHIHFGEIVNFDDSSLDLMNSTDLAAHINDVAGITYNDFTLQDFNTTAYRKKTSGTVRVGGSTKAGNFTLNLLNGLTCDRVTVYAEGYENDAAPTLNINGSVHNITPTPQGGTYSFTTSYIFEFDATSTLQISNNHLTSNGRVLISKIVLRLY